MCAQAPQKFLVHLTHDAKYGTVLVLDCARVLSKVNNLEVWVRDVVTNPAFGPAVLLLSVSGANALRSFYPNLDDLTKVKTDARKQIDNWSSLADKWLDEVISSGELLGQLSPQHRKDLRRLIRDYNDLKEAIQKAEQYKMAYWTLAIGADGAIAIGSIVLGIPNPGVVRWLCVASGALSVIAGFNDYQTGKLYQEKASILAEEFCNQDILATLQKLKEKAALSPMTESNT